MHPYFQYLFLVLLALALTSCSYSDDQIYYVDPVPGDSATVLLNTNLDPADTLLIVDSLLFMYSAEIEGGEIYFTEASIGNLILYQFATDYDPDTISGPYVLTDSFWIQSNLPLEEDLNTMFFSVFYSSNTNSLADKFRREANILELEFNLMWEGLIK